MSPYLLYVVFRPEWSSRGPELSFSGLIWQGSIFKCQYVTDVPISVPISCSKSIIENPNMSLGRASPTFPNFMDLLKKTKTLFRKHIRVALQNLDDIDKINIMKTVAI